MRFRFILTLAVSVFCFGMFAPTASEAGGWHRDHPPAGWGRVQPVRHWVYYPRYHHHYHRHPVTDPYAYRYVRPRYYPYYNSGYWRPASVMHKRRARYHQPKYYRAWGRNKRVYRTYHSRRWHHRGRW